MVGTGLVSGKDKGLCNNGVWRSGNVENNQLCNVFTVQWVSPLVDTGSLRGVTLESNKGELVSGNVTRLDFHHSDFGVDQFLSQDVSERSQSSLGGTVDTSTRVWVSTCDRTQLDNVTAVTFLHLLDNQLCQLDHPKDVGVEHFLDVLARDGANVVETKRLTGVVDKHVDDGKASWKVGEKWCNVLELGHVELVNVHLDGRIRLCQVGLQGFELLHSSGSEDKFQVTLCSLGEVLGGVVADPSGGPGDENGLPSKSLCNVPEHGGLLRSCDEYKVLSMLFSSYIVFFNRYLSTFPIGQF